MNPNKNLFELLKADSLGRITTESEGASLSQFARSQYMRVKAGSVGFDRGKDFFALFRSYTNEFWVYAILAEDGSIIGTASLARFDAIVNSVSKKVGVFGDLRLDPKAGESAKKRWRDVYQSVVAHLKDKNSAEHCDFVLTAIFQENEKALHIFKNRMPEVAIHQLRPYFNLSIFRPFFSPKQPTLKVESSATDVIESLKRPSLSFAKLPSGKRLEPIVVQNENSKILMGAVVFDARDARNLRVSNLPLGLRLGFKVLSHFSPVDYSQDLPWTMKSLSCVSWVEGLSPDDKLNSLTAALRSCFQDDSSAFHMLNITLMDEKLCRDLQKRFPISKMSKGWLCELTHADQGPSFGSEELAFEGAFF